MVLTASAYILGLQAVPTFSLVRASVCAMENGPRSRVKYAEIVGGGIIITFENGKCALFPDDLLYSTLPQAKVLPEPPDDVEQTTS
jgi:hypothetical protein